MIELKVKIPTYLCEILLTTFTRKLNLGAFNTKSQLSSPRSLKALLMILRSNSSGSVSNPLYILNLPSSMFCRC